MTADEKQGLKALLVATGLYYGQEYDDGVIVLFVEDLEDLPFESVRQAMKDIRRDPKVTRFPLPAQIRARVESPMSDEDVGRLVAGRIWEAIGKIGSYGAEAAKQYVGEVGWRVVQAMGGWPTVCQIHTDDRGIFMAQCRDLAESLQRAAKAGMLNKPFALPSPERKQITKLSLALPDMDEGA